ncbi:peptide ABC transporter substrate-binding protein [Pullulanibacillus camelliae]|uniref:Peptide ABC transporter substrate-binding protein n=1 Tax=Pullulanibacillus camelliae TaxID=1707096 RepID=A0A8J2VF94_9BACL|nr:ABC transporter permease [Pullulanibacillus camelliae]GGE28329.1 peptide ABC transporter substrate-binding protein [Pullulanibacillus camelliae]
MQPQTTETSVSVKVSKNEALTRRLKQFFKYKLAVIGLIVILVQIFLAIFANSVTSYSPTVQDLTHVNLKPGSPGHWLGTDNYGRDMWSRLVFGARLSLMVGFSSVIIGTVIGTLLGLLAGFYKFLDTIIMRISDLMFAFPGILLAMLIIAILGTSLLNVVIAISIWSIPSCARIVRGSVLSLKKQEYITAMRALGASHFRIIFQHILPNGTAPIIVFATMHMGTAILSTSALSFLGLGAEPSTPEWGAMISAGQQYMWQAPHLVIIPGIAIMLVVFAFNVVGDALRDMLDPNMKSR